MGNCRCPNCGTDHYKEEAELVDIPGFNGLYAITPEGRIFKRANMWMKPIMHRNGYPMVSLGRVRHAIHRLVAMVFVPNLNNHKYVNHKNARKDDTGQKTLSGLLQERTSDTLLI